MKNIFLVASIVLILISCGDTKYYPVSITNASLTKDVSYTYNGVSDTLAVSKSKTYEVEAYTQPPKDIADPNGIASLIIKTNSMTGDYTFYDAIPLDLNVVNRLPITVKIKADNYIDDNGSTEFTIGENTEKTTAKIYTSNPKFTSLVEYPIIIDWNTSGNTVYVIIR